MSKSDIFVWLDDVQFSKGSFTNRVQIKANDSTSWLTIPLEEKGRFKSILDLKSVGFDWIKSHRDKLSRSVENYPYQDLALRVFDDAAELAHKKSLAEFLTNSSEILAAAMKIQPVKTYRSSELGVEGSSWQRVLDIVKHLGGTEYLSAAGGANYLDHIEFEKHNIEVRYIDYKIAPWKQQLGDFTPYLTGLDLLAANGKMSCDNLQSETVHWSEYKRES